MAELSDQLMRVLEEEHGYMKSCMETLLQTQTDRLRRELHGILQVDIDMDRATNKQDAIPDTCLSTNLENETGTLQSGTQTKDFENTAKHVGTQLQIDRVQHPKESGTKERFSVNAEEHKMESSVDTIRGRAAFRAPMTSCTLDLLTEEALHSAHNFFSPQGIMLMLSQFTNVNGGQFWDMVCKQRVPLRLSRFCNQLVQHRSYNLTVALAITLNSIFTGMSAHELMSDAIQQWSSRAQGENSSNPAYHTPGWLAAVDIFFCNFLFVGAVITNTCRRVAVHIWTKGEMEHV